MKPKQVLIVEASPLLEPLVPSRLQDEKKRIVVHPLLATLGEEGVDDNDRLPPIRWYVCVHSRNTVRTR